MRAIYDRCKKTSIGSAGFFGILTRISQLVKSFHDSYLIAGLQVFRSISHPIFSKINDRDNSVSTTNTHFALNTSKQLVAMTRYLDIHKSAKAVLAAIVQHFDVSNQYAYIKQETIAKKCGLSLRQAQTWIKRLVDLKLIDKHNTLVFNKGCGRTVFGVNQYAPNLQTWKEMLSQKKVLSSYHRVPEKSNKANEIKVLIDKTAYGNFVTPQIDLSNKKNNKSSDTPLISFSTLKAFFSTKPQRSWLDYKTGLIYRSYKDFMNKINVLGYISGFKRSRLAVELIQNENIDIELIDREVIAEYERYKKAQVADSKRISTAWSHVRTEQFNYEYVDVNNRKFYFESQAAFEAHKKAFSRK